MTPAATGSRSPSLPHLMIESEVRQRRFSFSSNISNLQTNSCTSTPAKGSHLGRRSTFPHLFGTPGTTSSIPHHADLSSSFSEGDHYVEPLSKQYSPAEVAWDSGYYGTFDSPTGNTRVPLVRSETQKTWETFASPVLNIKKRLAGRPSFLDTSPRKCLLGKVTPQQVLASLVLVLTTISCVLVLFYLTDVGDKDSVVKEERGFRSIFGWGKISLDYPDDPQFRGSHSDNFEDGSVGLESDPQNIDEKTITLLGRFNNGQVKGLEVNVLPKILNSKPLVEVEAQILGEREEHFKNNILEERKRIMLDERRKKMWEKSELLRAKIAEERKERKIEERKKSMLNERVFERKKQDEKNILI